MEMNDLRARIDSHTAKSQEEIEAKFAVTESDLKQKISELESSKQDIKNDAENNKKEIKDAYHTIMGAKLKIKEGTNTIDNLKRERNRTLNGIDRYAKIRIDEVDKQIAEIQAQIEQAAIDRDKEIEVLNEGAKQDVEAFAEADEIQKNAEEAIKNENEAILKLKSAIESLEKDKKACEQELAKITGRFTLGKTSEQIEYEHDLEVIESELNKKRSELTSTEERIAANQKTIEDTKQTIKDILEKYPEIAKNREPEPKEAEPQPEPTTKPEPKAPEEEKTVEPEKVVEKKKQPQYMNLEQMANQIYSDLSEDEKTSIRDNSNALNNILKNKHNSLYEQIENMPPQRAWKLLAIIKEKCLREQPTKLEQAEQPVKPEQPSKPEPQPTPTSKTPKPQQAPESKTPELKPKNGQKAPTSKTVEPEKAVNTEQPKKTVSLEEVANRMYKALNQEEKNQIRKSKSFLMPILEKQHPEWYAYMKKRTIPTITNLIDKVYEISLREQPKENQTEQKKSVQQEKTKAPEPQPAPTPKATKPTPTPQPKAPESKTLTEKKGYTYDEVAEMLCEFLSENDKANMAKNKNVLMLKLEASQPEWYNYMKTHPQTATKLIDKVYEMCVKEQSKTPEKTPDDPKDKKILPKEIRRVSIIIDKNGCAINIDTGEKKSNDDIRKYTPLTQKLLYENKEGIAPELINAARIIGDPMVVNGILFNEELNSESKTRLLQDYSNMILCRKENLKADIGKYLKVLNLSYELSGLTKEDPKEAMKKAKEAKKLGIANKVELPGFWVEAKWNIEHFIKNIRSKVCDSKVALPKPATAERRSKKDMDAKYKVEHPEKEPIDADYQKIGRTPKKQQKTAEVDEEMSKAINQGIEKAEDR